MLKEKDKLEGSEPDFVERTRLQIQGNLILKIGNGQICYGSGRSILIWNDASFYPLSCIIFSFSRFVQYFTNKDYFDTNKCSISSSNQTKYTSDRSSLFEIAPNFSRSDKSIH